MSTTVKVRTLRTPVGTVRALEVEGPWTSACTARFSADGCDGVQWRPPKTKDRLACDHLVEFRPELRWLRMVTPQRMDDGAIGQLDRLESLSALTRGRNPLDLSDLTGLRHVALDDRPELTGFAGRRLEGAHFAFNQRRLAELEQASQLTQVKLEGSGTRSVDLSARMPRLTQLMVLTSKVESLDGLDAPNLVSLYLDGRRSDHVLDVGPLADLPNLRSVSIRGPRAVRNSRPLEAREGLSFGTHSDVRIES